MGIWYINPASEDCIDDNHYLCQFEYHCFRKNKVSSNLFIDSLQISFVIIIYTTLENEDFQKYLGDIQTEGGDWNDWGDGSIEVYLHVHRNVCKMQTKYSCWGEGGGRQTS